MEKETKNSIEYEIYCLEKFINKTKENMIWFIKDPEGWSNMLIELDQELESLNSKLANL